MQQPRMTTWRWMIVVALVAFALAFWQADSGGNPWQSACSVTFSPDGRTLAAGLYCGTFFNQNVHWCIGDIGQTVALFDAQAGTSQGVLESVRYRGAIWGLPSTPLGQFLDFSPDGLTLATGTWDGNVKLWAPATGQLTSILRTQFRRVRAVTFLSDGRRLAVVSQQDSVTLLDPANPGASKRFDSGAGVQSISISPDSKLIAFGSEHSYHGAKLWPVTGTFWKSCIPITQDGVLALQFGSNGRFLAMGGDETAQLWDLAEKRARFEVPGPYTVAVALSPDCEFMATAGVDGLRVWKTATGEQTGTFFTGGRIKSLAYSPDGSLLAAGDNRGAVTVWDTSTWQPLWSAHVDSPPPFNPISYLVGIASLVLLSGVLIRAFWRTRH